MRAFYRHVLPAIGLAAAVVLVAPAASALTAVTWRPHVTPLPAGALTHHEMSYFADVSCTARQCVGVGTYELPHTKFAGLITTRSGSGTTSVESPAPTGETSAPLSNVACGTSGECLTAPTETDYVDVLSGSTWTAEPIALPDGAADLFFGRAACWDDGCLAIGQLNGGSDPNGQVIIEESGGVWSAVPIADVTVSGTSYPVGLSAVSCRLNGSCEAVGNYEFNPGPGPEDGVSLPVIVTGSVTSGWTSAAAKLPPGAMHYRYEHDYPVDPLVAVSCPHSGPCVAVGRYLVAGYVREALILHNGTPVEGPVPAGGSYAFPAEGPEAVSCTSDTSCTIAGSYLDSSSDVQLFATTGSGSSWSVSAAPLPLPGDAATDPQADVERLSCGAATYCAIAGSYANTSDQGESVLLNGGGSVWSAVNPPPPVNNATTSMSAVSCTSSTCTAAGSYENSSGTTAPLLEVRTG